MPEVNGPALHIISPVLMPDNSTGRGDLGGHVDPPSRHASRRQRRPRRLRRIIGGALFILTWSFLILYPLAMLIVSYWLGLS